MAISEKLVKINEEVVAQEDLLAQIQAALEGKGSGGENTAVLKSLEVTENGTYTPDEGVDGFSSVLVNVDSGAFNWQTLNTIYTNAADPTDTYRFSLDLKSDTYAVLLRQSNGIGYYFISMLHPPNGTFVPLLNASGISCVNSDSASSANISYSNFTIEGYTLFGTLESYSGVGEYALIPLESTGTSSDTNFETWVFTLEDGSTVEKEIEVGA